MKKICFITTSRADFGMVSELIKASLLNKKIKTSLIVSGDHSKDVQREYKKNLSIIKKVKLSLNSFDNLRITLSFSNYMREISTKLKSLKPDIFVVFGDRYEMLAATISAYILRVPIAHVAGGEKTAGSLDEGFRHSITKMANLHFPTCEKHKKIIKQLGENPKTIFNYGSLNGSKILNSKILSKSELEKKLNIKFGLKNIVLTYHPETIEKNKSLPNLKLILEALKKLKNTKVIVTASNNDSEGVKMNSYIKKFVARPSNKNFYFKKNLGSIRYLSLLKFVNLVIGNSSSGISETPHFKIPTINLGFRQTGRTMPKSVINSKISSKAISLSLKKALKMKIKKNVLRLKKNTAKRIVNQLNTFNFKKYNLKLFYDN